MDRDTLHRAKLRIGIGVCTYEAIALAIDDPTVLPCITHLCGPRDTTSWHGRAPLVLALGCSTWTALHLLRPWLPRR